MKCSNCGYIYNGIDTPSNCPKCGYSFGGSEEEKKGLSTKSKVATGIGAAAGAAAGIGMLAYQNRDVVVDAGEIENGEDVNGVVDNTNTNVDESQNTSDVVDGTTSEDETIVDGTVTDGEETDVKDDSIVDEEKKPSGSSSGKKDDGIDSEKLVDKNNNKEESSDGDKKDSEDNNDEESSENKDDDKEEDKDDEESSENKEEDKDDDESSEDKDEDKDDEESSENKDEDKDDGESSDDKDKDDSSDDGKKDDDKDKEDSSNNDKEDDEDLTDKPNTGGDSGSGGRSGGGGLGDINFTPRQLDEAVSFFGMGVGGYAGSNTLSAAKECAGDALKTLQEASDLVSNLNPNGNRTITTTGGDMKSITSNIKAVTGANGAWGYLDSLENKTKNLYNSYRKLNADYEFYVYSDYIQEIEDAHKAGIPSTLQVNLESRGMDFESFAASVTNGYTNYFEDEIERITADGAKGNSWKDSLLYRIGVGNESDAYNTYEEVLSGLQGMRDAACITMYTLGTANINGNVLLNMDAHKTSDGLSYRDYIEQNVLDGLNQPDYMGTGKPSDEEADDYKTDSQKQLEMMVLDGYTKIPEGERQDNHNMIINSVQNHIQDVIDFYAAEKGSEANPEGLVPANHSVYKLAQIGVSNEAFKDGIYLSEDPREYPDGTIVPARSSSGNTFVDLFNQMTSADVDTRTDRSVFEEQFFLAQTCYDGTEREMYYYQDMLYGCNEETGEFRDGIGNDYILDVINSKDCTESDLRQMFGDDYEQYVTKDENGKYVFTDKVDDTVINNAFFAMNDDGSLYEEFPQYFEKDANGNVTFARGITIDYLAFEHFREKADQSVIANSEIMYQMQALAALGGYFPANSREYEAQYNSAYSSYEEAHAKWEEDMKEYEAGRLKEAPEEPKFEEMFPGLQSPDDRFTDQATQESARGIYLALAHGDVSIEDFLPDANPYPGVDDIWPGGSMSSMDLMDPAIAEKYGITQGLDLVFAEPAVNYTADEIKELGITVDPDKTPYEAFTDNILMGIENTDFMLTQIAERYNNVQDIQIQLRQEDKSDAWMEIFDIILEMSGLKSDSIFSSVRATTQPLGTLYNQADNIIDYVTGEKENPFERIADAWDRIQTAKSIMSVCNQSKTLNNDRLIQLNNHWKWIVPQYSDFDYSTMNISENYEINDFGLTRSSRAQLEQEILDGMSEEEKAKFPNNRSLEAHVNELADAREALILLDYMSKNDYNQLALAIGSNDRVRSYLKNFSYLGKHNGEFDQLNSVACLQYIYNTRSTATFTSLFNSTNSAGFNLEAQYRANLYLENMAAKNYEILNKYYESSPEEFQKFIEFLHIDDLAYVGYKLSEVNENIMETFALPAVNGVYGFVKNISYAILNPVEDLISWAFDTDFSLHSHIPSMNDAMWSYIMSGVDTGKLTQVEVYCMQAFTSMGNMAIPMIASAVVSYFATPAVGKWVGAGLMGLGAFGGSLEACKREGISDGYAYTYSILSAVSELLMERFVGGIFGPGGGTGFKVWFSSILSEVMEESVQELIDPLLSDIAAMLDPQYIKGIDGFTEGTFDVGLRELFTDPEAYLKRLLTEDFDPQAVFDAGVTAAISAAFMNFGKLGTAMTSLLKYKNSNITGLMSILQQDLIKNGYSKTQASIIVSQKLAIFLNSGIDINKAVQEAMLDENLKQQYEQWKQDRKAAEDNQSLKDKLFGEEDARDEYNFYNFVLEQVFNEITNGSNSDGSIPSLLEFDIENLLSKVGELEAQIAELSKNKDANIEQINKLQSEVNNILEETIPDLRSKIDQLQKEANDKIEKNKAQIADLQKELDKLGEELNKLNENDDAQSLIDEIKNIVEQIQKLETENTVLNIRNQSVSLSDLQNRIQSIKSQLEKAITKKQKETLQKELDVAQKNYADALVAEKEATIRDIVNMQENANQHNDVNGVNDVNNNGNSNTSNNKVALNTLINSYIIEVNKINAKLDKLKNEGVKFTDNTDTSIIKNVESDIETKNKVLTYLQSSVVGVGVIGMGLTSGGTGTISNIIKLIDNRINGLNVEKNKLQKLGNKENHGNKNDADISKRKYDVKQEIKQNKQMKEQLLREMANHGLTENSPITDLMDSVQSDINSYYGIGVNGSDVSKLAANNFDVGRRVQFSGVNADVVTSVDSIISKIDELFNIDIRDTSTFKTHVQQILDLFASLKSKLPGLENLKSSMSKVGDSIKSIDLSKAYNAVVASFTKIIDSTHIDTNSINQLKEQLVSFKDSVVKFFNEGLFKDAIAMSQNEADILDADFEVVREISSRDIYEAFNNQNAKIKDAFVALGKLVTDNKAINALRESIRSMVQKVQLDPGSVAAVNTEISSLRDLINKLKAEIAAKDAKSLSLEESSVLDADFEVIQEITAKDIYDAINQENMKVLESLNKIKELFKGNKTVSDMISSITSKINEIRNNVKLDASAITALKDQIIKLKAELAAKDAHSLSMEEAKILDAEFEVLDEISAKDIYDIALNEYGVNKAIEAINKSMNAIRNVISNIGNISLSRSIHQMIDSMGAKLNSLTHFTELQTKLNDSLEQMRKAIESKSQEAIDAAKSTVAKVKNEIIEFVKQNYNKDAEIFESVDSDSSVSNFNKSLVKSIDKLFGDLSSVLEKVRLDSTTRFKLVAEMQALKGRINKLMDNINKLSDAEIQSLKDALGNKGSELVQLVNELHSVLESSVSQGVQQSVNQNVVQDQVLNQEQVVHQDVANEVAEVVKSNADLINEAISQNNAVAIEEIANRDFGVIESMIRDGNISFLTVYGVSQDLINRVIQYVNANNISVDFGTNAGLAVNFLNNGLTVGFKIDSLTQLSAELFSTFNGSTVLTPQQQSVIRFVFDYLNTGLINKTLDISSLNEIITGLSRITLNGPNIGVVDTIISLMPTNLQMLTFKQTIAQYNTGMRLDTGAFAKLMYETGVKTMNHIIANYYTANGQINSAAITPILQIFTNRVLPANLTHEVINSILDPLAQLMGQEMRRLYFDFAGSEVKALKDTYYGIPIRVFVDNQANLGTIVAKVEQFKHAVRTGNIPNAIRSCVKIASFHDMINPQDYMWAMRYNGKNLPAGFTSGATGGSGNFNFWNGITGDADLTIISHEFGHCLDSSFASMFTNGGYYHFSDTSVWVNARKADANISLDRQSVTDYSANANCEDFADSVREFIMNRSYFESKFPNRAKVLNEYLTRFTLQTEFMLGNGIVKLSDIKDINTMANLMVQNGVNAHALNQILAQNPSLQSLKDAFVRQYAFSEDAITILQLNAVTDVNSMANLLVRNGVNSRVVGQIMSQNPTLQSLKDAFIRQVSLNENAGLVIQINGITSLQSAVPVLQSIGVNVNQVMSMNPSITALQEALFRNMLYGEDVIANLYLSDMNSLSQMVELMRELGANPNYIDYVSKHGEGYRTFKNGFHEMYNNSHNKSYMLSVLAKHSNANRNVGVNPVNHGILGRKGRNLFPTSQTSDLSPAMTSFVNTRLITEARNAYIKGDIARVFEIGTKNFEVIQDLLNNGKVDILAHEGISTRLLMDSIKYLDSINGLDSISDMTFELNSRRAVREMLDMGFYNFTVTKAKSDAALASCIEHIKNSTNAEGAKLLQSFAKNGNSLVVDILRNDSIKAVKKLQILGNCSNSMFTQLSNQMNLETKVKLFETIRGLSVDELFNIDTDAQYRRAEVFYNRVLSEYGTQMIQKMRVDKALPFKSNSVINMLRMNSSAYANMTEMEIMKEICEEKSAGQYKLIDLGYGMALKPIGFKGMNVRFFTNNQIALNNLSSKFEVFKAYYNLLPKTFASTLSEVNFLDMDDPDNDLYSITENNNINKRFTAAAAGGWGKFYLWRTSLDFATMTHEIGHSFDTEYYQIVHNREGFFSEKVTAWKNAKMKDGNSTVTNYGDTSLAEDFAESMAAFMKDQTEFTKNYPNRATEIKRMLRELTYVKFGINEITDAKTLFNHMLSNGISVNEIKAISKYKVSFNAVKNAYIDHLALGTDIQTSLATPNNNTFKIRPITMKSNPNAKVNNRVNNRVNNKAWFGNRVFANRSSNPMVNSINSAIAKGQTVRIELGRASEMSVQALREISDLSKVEFFVKGPFSDLNGNLKAKYNNPRYIARHTYTGTELLQINAKLDQLQSRIDMSLPITQRARQIYELIASEYSYLRPADPRSNKLSPTEYLVSQSLRGVTSNNLIGRPGLICAGYASVFKELCTRCGITADYIRGDVVVDMNTGEKGKHAWNVFINENGEVVPVDACWRATGAKRDYFGRSDMFAEGRFADADETYREYGPVRNQANNVQRVQVGFNDPKSMIDFAVGQMEAKYGPGSGIEALRRYLRTGDINSMTSSNGARNVLSRVSMTDIDAYIKANSYVDLSIYNGSIRNAFNSMINRFGSEQMAMKQLQAYARSGDLSYITSLNGARDIIESTPIEAVRQFVNNRLSNPYYSEHAAAPSTQFISTEAIRMEDAFTEAMPSPSPMTEAMPSPSPVNEVEYFDEMTEAPSSSNSIDISSFTSEEQSFYNEISSNSPNINLNTLFDIIDEARSLFTNITDVKLYTFDILISKHSNLLTSSQFATKFFDLLIQTSNDSTIQWEVDICEILGKLGDDVLTNSNFVRTLCNYIVKSDSQLLVNIFNDVPTLKTNEIFIKNLINEVVVYNRANPQNLFQVNDFNFLIKNVQLFNDTVFTNNVIEYIKSFVPSGVDQDIYVVEYLLTHVDNITSSSTNIVNIFKQTILNKYSFLNRSDNSIYDNIDFANAKNWGNLVLRAFNQYIQSEFSLCISNSQIIPNEGTYNYRDVLLNEMLKLNYLDINSREDLIKSYIRIAHNGMNLLNSSLRPLHLIYNEFTRFQMSVSYLMKMYPDFNNPSSDLSKMLFDVIYEKIASSFGQSIPTSNTMTSVTNINRAYMEVWDHYVKNLFIIPGCSIPGCKTLNDCMEWYKNNITPTNFEQLAKKLRTEEGKIIKEIYKVLQQNSNNLYPKYVLKKSVREFKLDFALLEHVLTHEYKYVAPQKGGGHFESSLIFPYKVVDLLTDQSQLQYIKRYDSSGNPLYTDLVINGTSVKKSFWFSEMSVDEMLDICYHVVTRGKISNSGMDSNFADIPHLRARLLSLGYSLEEIKKWNVAVVLGNGGVVISAYPYYR